jgi:prevent-host-death family protein
MAEPAKRIEVVAVESPDCEHNETSPVLSALHGMTIILVMSETLPLAEIKARLSEIVDRVEREHERVVLTRNGRPAAVIMSPADLEALEDTLELLSDPRALEEIRAARDDIARGRSVSAEQLRAKYLRP